jgi:hypothetical protein
MSFLTPKPRYKRKGNGQFDGSAAQRNGRHGIDSASAPPIPFTISDPVSAASTGALYRTDEMLAELEAALDSAVSFTDRFRRLAARRRIESTFGPVDWAA